MGGASVLVGGGVSKKIIRWEVPPMPPTMGNPEKNHLTIKNNCSILKKQ